MTRGVARYLVGSLVVLGLAACGKSWLAERDAWRHEAEVACLKSGQVKEGPALVRVQPITGPGICGADFPLKVAALGEGTTDRLRRRAAAAGAIPAHRRASRSPPRRYSPQAYARRAYPEPYPRGRRIRRSRIRQPSLAGVSARRTRRCRSRRPASRRPNPTPRTTRRAGQAARNPARNRRRPIPPAAAQPYPPQPYPQTVSGAALSAAPNRCRSGANARR